MYVQKQLDKYNTYEQKEKHIVLEQHKNKTTIQNPWSNQHGKDGKRHS